MKKIFVFLMLVLMMWGCTESAMNDDYATYSISATKSQKPVERVLDEPYTFFSENNSSDWAAIGSLEERFKMCQIPEDTLRLMTTEALVKSMIQYPLNYLVLFYNEPLEAIDIIYKSSSLHRELASRDDAAEIVLHFFNASREDMDPEKNRFDDDFQNISYADEIALEYFLASDLFPQRNIDCRALLQSSVQNKLEWRLSDTLTYSMFSLLPLLRITENHTFDRSPSPLRSIPPAIIGSSNTTTFFGKHIYGLILQELTNTEIMNLNNDVVLNYSNVIIRGNATSAYNCHSYAWYSQLTNLNNLWINHSDETNTFQLSRYWTNDLFDSCASSEAERVYYSSGDHSALVLSSGNYISKWGYGPLVEHAPNDAPYSSTNNQYYRIRTTPLTNTYSIQGQDYLSPNVEYTFTATPPHGGMTMSWTVYPLETTSPNSYSLTPLTNSCRATFYEESAYYLRSDAYYEGRNVACDTKLLLVYGSI